MLFVFLFLAILVVLVVAIGFIAFCQLSAINTHCPGHFLTQKIGLFGLI
jgi:hypothetical protein